MESRLTPKQQLFVEAYLATSGNATEAARRAGYKGNDVTVGAVGRENLRKPLIADAIAKRLATAKKCLQADEVLALLTDQAVSTVDDFFDLVDVETPLVPDPAACDDSESPAEPIDRDAVPMRKTVPVLNLAKAKERGKLGLVKKLSFNQYGPVLELYSAQAALELLGRHHGLFTDNLNLGAKQSLLDVVRAATAKGKR